MSEKELEKIEHSSYLPDEAKEQYKQDRERFLKEKIEKDEKALDSAFENIKCDFVFNLT